MSETKIEGEKSPSVFELKADLYQKDIEAFEIEFERRGGLESQASSRIAGAALRAAIKAEWVLFPHTEALTNLRGESRHMFDGREVGGLKAGMVKALGLAVYRRYRVETAIDPNW